MLPLLRAGDLVLVDRRAYHTRSPQVDELVVAWHPLQRQLIVKRVAAVQPGGYVVLHSDNPQGSDSRQFGAVAINDVIGKVTSCSRAHL
jgi:nickel-type superoxide dismutase maturation protease